MTRLGRWQFCQLYQNARERLVSHVQLFSADEMRWLRVLRDSQWEKTQLMNPFSNDRFDILCGSIYSSAYKL